MDYEEQFQKETGKNVFTMAGRHIPNYVEWLESKLTRYEKTK